MRLYGIYGIFSNISYIIRHDYEKDNHMRKRKEKTMNIKFYNYNIMENFYRLNRGTCITLYNQFNEPYQCKITFDQYLNNAEETKKELFRVATLEGKKTFVCAPTGTGKTYTIITEIFQEIMEQKSQNTIYMNLLLVPNRSQSEQIQEEYEPYKIKSIVGVGKNEQPRKISMTRSQDYSFVFDKIDDLKEVLYYFKNNNIKFKVCMVVDEAHTLTVARFRNRAIEKAKEFGITLNEEQENKIERAEEISALLLYF